MIGALMRRDAARGAVARWAFISAIGATALLNTMTLIRVFTEAGADELAVFARILAVVLVAMPPLGFLGFLAVERRYRPFDLSLPVPARSLWLAHTLSSLLWSGVVMSVVVVVTGVFVAWLRADIGPEFGMSLSTVVGVLFPAACGVVFAGLLFQSFRAERSRLSAVRGDGVVVLLMVLGVLVVLSALSLVPFYWSLLLPLGGWLIARQAYGRLPAAFEFIERSRGATRSRGTAVAALPSGGSRRGLLYQLRLNWTIYFSVNHKPWVGAFVGYPTILAAGFGLSGFKYAAEGGDAIRFMLIAITAYIFVAFTGLIPRRLFRTDPWPVTRARVFAAAAVPFVIVLALGYAVGTVWGDVRANEREHVRLLLCGDEGERWFCMQVPVANCEIVANGAPPTLTSPWGETHTPEPMPVWRDGAFAVYSPFSVGPGSSPEFVALQASRAVKAVYDTEITPETIMERYLLRADDGTTRVRDGGMTLREDFPELRREPLGPMFPAIMLVLHALWLVPLIIVCRPLRAGVPEKTRKWFFGGTLVALMGLHFAQYGIVIAHRISMVPASGTAMIAVRHLRDALPGGTVSVWVLCGALIALLYLLAIRALGRTESVPGDDVCAELLPAMR